VSGCQLCLPQERPHCWPNIVVTLTTVVGEIVCFANMDLVPYSRFLGSWALVRYALDENAGYPLVEQFRSGGSWPVASTTTLSIRNRGSVGTLLDSRRKPRSRRSGYSTDGATLKRGLTRVDGVTARQRGEIREYDHGIMTMIQELLE
jgi:hypothetical protein